MSALPPKADIAERDWHVRFVPLADMGPKPKRTKCAPKWLRVFPVRVGYRNKIRRHETETRLPVVLRSGQMQVTRLLRIRIKSMRARSVRCLVHMTVAGFASALVLVAVPGRAFTDNRPIPSGEQKQTEQDRCRFVMENINATILSLNTEGAITFLNRYGQRFFGYSPEEILGKPMLGTLTPLAGFEGRDLTTFMAGVVHHPNRYAFSVNTNMLHDGRRVWTFWSNKGVSDDQGKVREVLRVGLDITDRKLRLEALAQELRSISEMLNGRDWVQRSKLKEITSRIETISEELERPWSESDTRDYESVAPSH